MGAEGDSSVPLCFCPLRGTLGSGPNTCFLPRAPFNSPPCWGPMHWSYTWSTTDGSLPTLLAVPSMMLFYELDLYPHPVKHSAGVRSPHENSSDNGETPSTGTSLRTDSRLGLKLEAIHGSQNASRLSDLGHPPVFKSQHYSRKLEKEGQSRIIR